MIDAICDICGKQTAEPYEIEISALQDTKVTIIDHIICRSCARGIANDIAYSKYKFDHIKEQKDVFMSFEDIDEEEY